MLLNRAEVDNPRSTIWDSTSFFAAELITWIQCSKKDLLRGGAATMQIEYEKQHRKYY
jgi:hypothetical protein